MLEPDTTYYVRVQFYDACLEPSAWSDTFYEYDTISGWQEYSQHTTFGRDMRSVILEVKDGGYGDTDGVANGVIVDPGGLVTLEASEGTASEGGECLISTIAFGSRAEAIMDVLRDFRDEYLLTNAPGRWFVKIYYRYGSCLADYVETHSRCKPFVRFTLMPMLALVCILLETSTGFLVPLLLTAIVLICHIRVHLSRGFSLK